MAASSDPLQLVVSGELDFSPVGECLLDGAPASMHVARALGGVGEWNVRLVHSLDADGMRELSVAWGICEPSVTIRGVKGGAIEVRRSSGNASVEEVDGDSDVGKAFRTLMLAARVARGSTIRYQPGKPASPVSGGIEATSPAS